MASYDYETHDTTATRAYLRQLARKSDQVIGLDTGPWLMAGAGLLQGRRATVHWDVLDAFSERHLDVQAERAHVVRDGVMVTCAGAMSALELILELIADHLGQARRLEVETLFMYGDHLRNSDTLLGTDDPLVRAAMGKMRARLEHPLPLTELCHQLSCQPRMLDRHFRKTLGASPGRVYRHMRLAEARNLLSASRLSIAEVALRTGYENASALARAIKRQYGVTPSQLKA